MSRQNRTDLPTRLREPGRSRRPRFALSSSRPRSVFFSAASVMELPFGRADSIWWWRLGSGRHGRGGPTYLTCSVAVTVEVPEAMVIDATRPVWPTDV